MLLLDLCPFKGDWMMIPSWFDSVMMVPITCQVEYGSSSVISSEDQV